MLFWRRPCPPASTVWNVISGITAECFYSQITRLVKTVFFTTQDMFEILLSRLSKSFFLWLKIHLSTLVNVMLQRIDLNYLSAPLWWVDIFQTLCPPTELKHNVWTARPSRGYPNDITESHNRHYANLYRGCIQRASPAIHGTIFSIYVKIRSSHFTSLTVTFWGLSPEITVVCFRCERLILCISHLKLQSGALTCRLRSWRRMPTAVFSSMAAV